MTIGTWWCYGRTDERDYGAVAGIVIIDEGLFSVTISRSLKAFSAVELSNLPSNEKFVTLAMAKQYVDDWYNPKPCGFIPPSGV